jgi:hypothetical protein
MAASFAARLVDAQPNANADICAADNDGAFPPPQRIAACTALIEATKDAPKLAAGLVNRGAAYWYINKILQALTDLDHAIALDRKTPALFANASIATARLATSIVHLPTPTRRCGSIPRCQSLR